MEVDVGEKKHWSFLTFSIGMISDIDILSEHYRKWLGPYRYIVGALEILVKSLCKKNHHKGILSYLPDDKECKLPGEFKTIKGDFTMLMACNTEYPSYNVKSPDTKHDNGMVMLTVVQNGSWFTMLKILLGIESGKYAQMKEVQRIYTSSFRYEALDGQIITLDGELLNAQRSHQNFKRCDVVQCQVHRRALRVFCDLKTEKKS